QSLAHLRDAAVRITVVGDGRERAAVEAMAGDLGVADRIAWAGIVPNAAALMRAFDVLVLSSRTEGTPITLLEAMSAEVPIVATAVGGVPDVIGAAEGILVPAEDPLALAEAIRGVAANPSAAAERAVKAKRRLETVFAIEPWVAAHERV